MKISESLNDKYWFADRKEINNKYNQNIKVIKNKLLKKTVLNSFL